MPVPSLIEELDVVAGLNYPVGGEDVFPQLDNYLRAHAAFIAQLREMYVDQNTEAFVIPISDQTTALTTGTKMTWRMPYAFTVTGIRASVNTAQASGDALRFDVKEGGTSLMSTLVTIDNTEKTSTTAAVPCVIIDTAIAEDAELTFIIDRVGTSTAAKGAVITLIGYQ